MKPAVRYTFDAISQKKSAFSENFGHIRELHDCLKIKNMNPDGYLPYPKINSAEDAKEGMRVEFRDVTFKYPSSEHLALKNVSFTLASSSLVVIVGSNGSGKSSIVKLLSNLYHPTSGSILIDDIPIESYLGTDLRRSTALLTQNHMLFPLNASENIGIGDPEAAHDINRIKEAAKLGGAYEFVEKLSKGWDENLDIVWTRWASQYPMYPGPLKENLDKVEKRIEISGGEAQRLAASRAFMRVMSGKMKLLIVDEPTSAMDPEGEFQLLERLREMRLGKTVVFVTHRFGHLTKHADLILCMKDGELIESGTHQALMEKKSEYFKLYSIQALAFANDQPKSTSPNLVGPIL